MLLSCFGIEKKGMINVRPSSCLYMDRWKEGRKEKKKQREKNGDCICTLARLVR